MKIKFVILAIVASISCTSAQWQDRGRTSCGNCACLYQYEPYCGIDNRGKETTYSSLCELECAKQCTPGLRVKFEGVCAEPYRNVDGNSKINSGNPGSWGSSSYDRSRSYRQSSIGRPILGSGPAPPTRRYQLGSGPAPPTRRYQLGSGPAPPTRRYQLGSGPAPPTRRIRLGS